MSCDLLDFKFFQTILDMTILNPTQLAPESNARKEEKTVQSVGYAKKSERNKRREGSWVKTICRGSSHSSVIRLHGVRFPRHNKKTNLQALGIFLTIILRARVGYEISMIDSQRGA